jgi:hypothetical protein
MGSVRYVYNLTVHITTSFTPFELLYGFRSKVPSALREASNTQYNYEDYLSELRGRLQSSHEVARQKLLAGKIKSKEYYEKDSETVEVRTGQKVLLVDETVRRGRSEKLSPQYIGPYEVLEVEGVNVVIKRVRYAQMVHINRIRPFINKLAWKPPIARGNHN